MEIPSATVSVTETAVLDRALEVGSQAQTVTVEGEVEAIQTTSSALGTVANARTVTEIPLNTRNYTNLLAYVCRCLRQRQQRDHDRKGRDEHERQWRDNDQNTYLLDGMVVNNLTATARFRKG